jgi:hypothetical protein
MPTLNQAAFMSDTLAKDYVTTAGFSQVDSQRNQAFSQEQIPLLLNETSCRGDASSYENAAE